MAEMPVHVVTGAYGYSGRFIAQRLLARRIKVRTLTNSPDRAHAFGGAVEARPLAFDTPDRLTESLKGADVLYNTYWVRFTVRGEFSHDEAVRNSATLFRCARQAGIRRIVHVSILNPSPDSPYPYFRGKARVEEALAASGVPAAILRPAVLFGHGDILLNNIAWLLRHAPVFGLFGDGAYRLRPIHVEDFADLAVSRGTGEGTGPVDAIGPDRPTYRELVTGMAKALGLRRVVVGLPPVVGLAAGIVAGWFLRDQVITREEIGGLMDGLLDSTASPAGHRGVMEWVAGHAKEYGLRYANELARRHDRRHAYDEVR